MKGLSKTIKLQQTNVEGEVKCMILNAFGIVFPKLEIEIVNKILRLRRVIVDTRQILSDPVLC